MKVDLLYISIKKLNTRKHSIIFFRSFHKEDVSKPVALTLYQTRINFHSSPFLFLSFCLSLSLSLYLSLYPLSLFHTHTYTHTLSLSSLSLSLSLAFTFLFHQCLCDCLCLYACKYKNCQWCNGYRRRKWTR